MKIRRLKLSGFKSFVDPAELRIEPGLTGIVGPNGCGKSNLLEAIRWVMGESSPKSMRGGGMEDVIFAGTERRPAREFAEVSMLLDADGDLGETEIVRRIERGAGSAYRIDGRDARAKDVALIFADAATGAHSPALVSQGRIGAIIAAKPAERRQMLEEAAGIAGLHVRRKDAEIKLRATETNLSRLDEVLADMEARAGALRRQARAAERYRQLSTLIRETEARLIFARWREAARSAEQARAEAAAAERTVAEATDAQRAAAAVQAETTEALVAARNRAQAAREAAQTGEHALATLRSEAAGVERRLADIARQRETLERDREREGALASDAATAIERLDAEAATLRSRSAAATIERNALAETLAAAELAARDAEVAHSRAVAEQAVEEADARVARAALASARQRLERAEREVARIAAERATLGDAAPLLRRKEDAARSRDDAEAAIADARAGIAGGEEARHRATAARDEAGQMLAAARATRAGLASEAKALAQAGQGGGRGVLAQLRAAPGYERALGAALGDDLSAPLGTGARGWAGADIDATDPVLPEGLEPLSDQVDAPVEIARRLAQIGVADEDRGQALAVGQRLVTRDGRLRRWDGYVATGEGAGAAERLIRANRLTELERVLPEADAEVARREMLARDADAALAQANQSLERDRRALGEAEARLRTALRDGDSAQAGIERLDLLRAEVERRAGQAEAERVAATDAVAEAERMVADRPPAERMASRVAELAGASQEARTAAADRRGKAAALDRAIGGDAERLAAIRREVAGWKSRAGDAAKRIGEMAARVRAAEEEAAELADKPAAIAAAIEKRAGEVEADRAAAIAAETAERVGEGAARAADAALAAAGEALAQARETRAGAVARAENQEQRRIEMGRISGERFECAAAALPEKIGFASTDVADVADESAALERATAERERLGPVNLVAESELAELEETRATLSAEREELGEAVNRLRGSIGSLNREGRARLRAAFEAVDGHFRRLFQTLFEGGEAHLALVDSDDPLEAGLEIMAQPPGKKLAALTLLSGGEQALTAVALIFGLFLTNPAPICVLDEVDAPLDDANVERFCDLLDRMTQETETRYLIVTHNAVTMSRMARLFGVTMIERGVSRLVSVDLGGANRLLAAE